MVEKKISVQLTGFWPALAILFIALKLCGVIQWSWIWVLVPLWGPVAVVMVVLAFMFVGISGAFVLAATLDACGVR